MRVSRGRNARETKIVRRRTLDNGGREVGERNRKTKRKKLKNGRRVFIGVAMNA
jgi:hypothetical protein